MKLAGQVRDPWMSRRELAVRLDGDIALAALARVAGSDQNIDGAIHMAVKGQWAGQTLRLDELQAAFLRVKLRKLDDLVKGLGLEG